MKSDVKIGSKFHGGCKYDAKSVPGELGMENCGYHVTKYMQAMLVFMFPVF